MSVQVIPKENQGYGAFNGGEIIENKPIGFPQDGGEVKPFSNLFYWAYAEAKVESTIGLHPHQGFEIMSFVLNGKIEHFDTQLNDWKSLNKGDAQIIRAGKGISHAEKMGEGSVMFQIWVDPSLQKTMQQPASYDDYRHEDFPVKTENGISIKIYSGDGAPLTMDTPGMNISEWSFEKGSFEKATDLQKIYSIYILEGEVILNGEKAAQDAFVIVQDTNEIKIETEEGGRLFVIASDKKLNYPTYAEMMQARMRR
ncbi:MAG: pirin family protein [Saprospiraceae bacterium]